MNILIKIDRQTLRLLRAAILLATFPSMAAQTHETNSIRVVLEGCHLRRDLDTIDLVLNDNEEVPAKLTTTDPKRIVWTGEWHDSHNPHVHFPALGSHASLRLEGSRTDCQSSSEDKNSDTIEAKFVFHCDQNRVWNVLVEAQAQVLFSYVRILKSARNEAFDRDCSERSRFVGTWDIRDVRLPPEVVNLGLDNPDRDQLWMRLNNLPIINKPKKGASETLGHDRIVREIVKSTRGEEFSGNAYDNPNISSKVKPETKITVTVH